MTLEDWLANMYLEGKRESETNMLSLIDLMVSDSLKEQIPNLSKDNFFSGR